MKKKDKEKRSTHQQQLSAYEVYLASCPDWYWKSGLHDARILSVTDFELPYDWKERKPLRNCLELSINAKGAMFDSKVTKISFFNYKILTPEFDLHRLDETWWMSDRLTTLSDGCFELVLTVDSGGNDLNVKIRFDIAEVERKK